MLLSYRRICALGWLVLALCLPFRPESPAPRAQDTLRAAAVVNDKVISMLDLAMRVRLAALSSGIELTAETQRRLQGQVLRQLIDERLQVQEAERLNIIVDDAVVLGQIEKIAQQNKMSRQQFESVLLRNNILPVALQEKVQADLSWQQLVQLRLLPRITIGDEEINEVAAHIEANMGGSEVRLGDIFLEVESVDSEQEVRRVALRLLEQLRTGAGFAGLASQFSQSATASVGGDMGWLPESQLPQELVDVVRQMQPGRVVGPVRGFSGYHILLLRDRRRVTFGEITIRLKQILLDLPTDAGEPERQALLRQAEELRAEIKSCPDAERISGEVGAPGSGDLGLMRMADLSEQLRPVVQRLSLEQPSEPIEIPGGLAILLVCERTGAAVDRDQIARRLKAQRLQVLSRQYLRDLRRAANVDLRL